jgi:hypothetical protein
VVSQLSFLHPRAWRSGVTQVAPIPFPSQPPNRTTTMTRRNAVSPQLLRRLARRLRSLGVHRVHTPQSHFPITRLLRCPFLSRKSRLGFLVHLFQLSLQRVQGPLQFWALHSTTPPIHTVFSQLRLYTHWAKVRGFQCRVMAAPI